MSLSVILIGVLILYNVLECLFDTTWQGLNFRVAKSYNERTQNHVLCYYIICRTVWSMKQR